MICARYAFLSASFISVTGFWRLSFWPERVVGLGRGRFGFLLWSFANRSSSLATIKTTEELEIG